MSKLILKSDGTPFATAAAVKRQLTLRGLSSDYEIIEYKGGYAAKERVDDPVTLHPGDYIATEFLSEDDYHDAARAFLAAGADKGEYPDDDHTDQRAFGWDNRSGRLFHGRPGSDGDFIKALNGRQLTLAQILSATNAGVGDNSETTTQQEQPTMHITDLLFEARKERDEAQQRYEQVLADHRATYPWLVVEEGEQQQAEDMTDPSNWRAGDLITSLESRADITKGKQYVFVSVDADGDYNIEADDVGDECYLNEGELYGIAAHNTNRR